jgi:hypothetical protein
VVENATVSSRFPSRSAEFGIIAFFLKRESTALNKNILLNSGNG